MLNGCEIHEPLHTYLFLILPQHLAALLITQQILGQILETVVPYLMYKRRKIEIRKRHKAEDDPDDTSGISESERLAAKIDGSKDAYMVSADLGILWLYLDVDVYVEHKKN